MNEREIEEKQSVVLTCDEKSKSVVVQMKTKNYQKTFSYDMVFGPTASQKDIYTSAIAPIVEDVLKGYNCTVFAYGQTGTGKTYTMEGLTSSSTNTTQKWKNNQHAGIISRAVHHIFESLEKSGTEYCVKVSHLELYNEELFDLLKPDNKNLKIYEDAKGVQVHDLEERLVYNPQDIFEILEASWQERKTAETKLNKNSSRSHCIFSITLHIKETTPEGEDLLKIGKLNLVDLAGSENIGRSGADQNAERKTEAGMINKSLLTLGRVITALTDNSPHVPYRESKLTRLLQDSLGGTTKTCIIATVSPASGCLEETLSTLDYAHRAKNIRNKPEVNQKMKKQEMLREYALEINELKRQLEAARNKNGVYLPKDIYDKLEGELKSNQENIQRLEERIAQKEKELAELQELFEKQTKELSSTIKKLDETKDTLQKTSDELKMTQKELENTKENLEEHKVVISTHEKTECIFQSEAATLLQTVSQTISDINELHAKIERKNDLDQKNLQSTKEFKKITEEQVHNSQLHVKEFIAQQTNRYNSLHNDIASFVQQKDKEILRLEERIQDLEKLINNAQSNLSNLCQKHQQLLEQNFTDIGTEQKQLNEAIVSLAQQFNKASKHLIELLSQSIRDYHTEIEKWASKRKQEITESLELSQNFLLEHRTTLSNLQTHLEHNVESQTNRYKGHLDELQSFLVKQQQENDSLQKTIIESVQSILTSHFRSQQQRTEEYVNAIKQSFDMSIHDLATLKENFSTQVQQTKQKCAEYSYKTLASQGNLMNTIDSLLKTSSGFVAEVSLQNENVSQSIIGHNENIVKNVEENRKNVAIALDCAKAQLQSYRRSCCEQLNLMEIEGADLRKELLNTAEEAKNSIHSRAQDWITKLQETKTNIESFGEEYFGKVQQLQENLKSFTFNVYQPTGQTPAKKNWSYPRTITKFKPKEDIIDEFRKAKANGLIVNEFSTVIVDSSTTNNNVLEGNGSNSHVCLSEESAEEMEGSKRLPMPPTQTQPLLLQQATAIQSQAPAQPQQISLKLSNGIPSKKQLQVSKELNLTQNAILGDGDAKKRPGMNNVPLTLVKKENCINGTQKKNGISSSKSIIMKPKLQEITNIYKTEK
jgi:kinesin family protein 11